MDDIEKELIAAGARWREAVETTEQARPEPRVRGTVRTRLTHETAVLWGVLGVLAGIVALQMLGAGSGPRPLAIGARVRGEGTIVSRGGDVSLCVLALGRLEPGASPVCSNIAVTLVDLARADMPQVEEANGVAFIRWANVTGTWTSKGIRVDGVEPREHPGPALPTSPCTATSAMPSVSDQPPIDIERDLAALAEHVAGAPNRYSGVWSASDVGQGAPSNAPVTVVGTVGDPQSEHQDLDALVSFPLCIVHVKHSASALSDTLSRIRDQRKDWTAEIDLPYDAVRVSVVSIDDDAIRLIRSDSAVIVDPLVEQLDGG